MTLAERLRSRLAPLGASDKKMFGGTCFMINGNMLIGTLKQGLIVRVGKAAHADALRRPGARTFDMTGRPMEGYVMVAGEALADDTELQHWIELALAFVKTLPAKPGKGMTAKIQAAGKMARTKSR
jgi:TfoX/Sxy family transcriptional regulator of competence genes